MTDKMKVYTKIMQKLKKMMPLDFIHLVDKKREQDKLISPTKEKSNAYLASRNYDRIDAIYASI
jgi:hypothetical protein